MRQRITLTDEEYASYCQLRKRAGWPELTKDEADAKINGMQEWMIVRVLADVRENMTRKEPA